MIDEIRRFTITDEMRRFTRLGATVHPSGGFGTRLVDGPKGFGTRMLTSFRVQNTFTATAMNIHGISCEPSKGESFSGFFERRSEECDGH